MHSKPINYNFEWVLSGLHAHNTNRQQPKTKMQLFLPRHNRSADSLWSQSRSQCVSHLIKLHGLCSAFAPETFNFKFILFFILFLLLLSFDSSFFVIIVFQLRMHCVWISSNFKCGRSYIYFPLFTENHCKNKTI